MNPSSSLLAGEARSDIQGFVTSGYGHLPAAAYLFLRVINAAACRRWIGTRLDAIATSAPWPRDDAGRPIKPATAVNIAFTAEGLRLLVPRSKATRRGRG